MTKDLRSTDSKRTRRGRIAALAVVLAASTAWLIFDRLSDRTTDDPAPGDVRRKAARATVTTSPPERLRSAGVDRRPAHPAGDRDEAACQATHQTPPTAELQAIYRPWAERARQRLNASDKPIDRAVGLLVGNAADWTAGEWKVRRDAVARSALASSDPTLYALALDACSLNHPSAGQPAGDCEQLNARQLRQLDTDNLASWLREAWVPSNADARGNALYQASIARHVDARAGFAAEALTAALPADTPAWAAYGLLWKLDRNRHALDNVAAIEVAEMACGPAALADNNVRQICDRIAQNLLGPDESPYTLTGAVMIATALGWSNERLAPYRSDLELLSQIGSAMPDAREAPCGGSSQALELVQARAGPHPMQALRDTLRRLHIDDAELERPADEGRRLDKALKYSLDQAPDQGLVMAPSTIERSN